MISPGADLFAQAPIADSGEDELSCLARWAIRNLNSEAVVALASKPELALVVREYLRLIAAIEATSDEKEREHFETLRCYAVGRIDEFLLERAVEPEEVDAISVALRGEKFESAYDWSRLGMKEVVTP